MTPVSRVSGLPKSITVMAALELGKRRKLQDCSERAVIRSSTDIAELFHPLLCDLATEEFWVLLLNQASKVIDKVRISRGGIDQTTAAYEPSYAKPCCGVPHRLSSSIITLRAVHAQHGR